LTDFCRILISHGTKVLLIAPFVRVALLLVH